MEETDEIRNVKKQYGSGSSAQFERKLSKVMERLGVEKYSFNWDRWSCWVEFEYKGETYRIDHNLEKASTMGIELSYGSDAFAETVITLEDLARIYERGIYDLSTWVAGMKIKIS